MDFVYLFRIVLRRKWIIIGSAIIAAAIAWYLTRDEKYTYRSSSRISTGFAVPDQVRVDDKFTLYDAEVKFNNAITTWTSPSVLNLVSYDLILHDLKSTEPFRHLTPEQLNYPAYKSINKEEAIKVYEESSKNMTMLSSYKPEEKKLLDLINLYGYDVKKLGQSLALGQVARTDYLQAEAVTDHPDLSAFIVNKSFEEFIRYYKGLRNTTAQESVDTLKSIMDKKKQELDEKTKQLTGEGGGDLSGNESTQGLIADLEKDLTAEKNKQTDAYFELRKINQKIAAFGSTGSTGNNNNNNEEFIIARKAMNEAYTEYTKSGDAADLKKYNQLKTEFYTKFPSKPSTETKTADGLAKLKEQKNDVEVDIDASKAKANTIEQKIYSLKGNVNVNQSRDARSATLQEEVKFLEDEWKDAKQKYTTAYYKSSSDVNNFRQIQEAQPAIGPEPSKRKIMVAMAGVVGFFISLLIIILLAVLDSSIKTPAIFSKTVNLKLISMVNFMNLKHKHLRDIVKGHIKEENKIEKQRNNVFRESLRKLRFEIEKSGKKIFLFTSTQKGQGKTTLIQALSYSMSLSNKKILIIDTNFCNNDLTVQLNANPVLETITIDESKEPLDKQIKALAKDVGAGSVFAIGSEGGDYTPSEILPRHNLLQQLHSITDDFDYIFLEGPPLNEFTDSKELLQYVDGVIAIFSATHIIKQIDKESLNFYKDLNGKFIGSVLNKVDLKNINVI
ncbi:MAG: AAA family ATPase [Chitinophagaceae bacterium]